MSGTADTQNQSEIHKLIEEFPFWEKLSAREQKELEESVRIESYERGTLLHRSSDGCKGLVIVKEGQLRSFIVSVEGREVTLYRMGDGDICVLTASCLMESIAFDVMIEAMEDSEVYVIPSAKLHLMMEQNPYVEVYMYKNATEKFSEVMWSMQQILFWKVDQRVAVFLWDERERRGSDSISITHDELARYIGSAREVVTKVLKYLAEEGAIMLGRGCIEIIDEKKLKKYL